MEFHGADALEVGHVEVEADGPFPQGYVGTVEDGSGLDREALTAIAVTAPKGLRLPRRHCGSVNAAAVGADGAIEPSLRNEPSLCLGLGVEALDDINEADSLAVCLAWP